MILPVMAWLSMLLDRPGIAALATNKRFLGVVITLAVSVPFLAHWHVERAFAAAGYGECGSFLTKPEADKSQSLFPSRAWVLNPGDCAEADAPPPPAAR